MTLLYRYKGNPILTPDKKKKWEAGAVFNCCVIEDNGVFHMLYRAVASGFRRLPNGWVENYVSSIGHPVSKDGIHCKKDSMPLIKPEYAWENFLGCEDPRVTKIGDTFYIFYTAVSKEKNTPKARVRIALATTKYFRRIKKHGIVGPDEKSKAAILFPEKIDGKYVMFFTLYSDSPVSHVAVAEFSSLQDLTRPPKSYWHNFLKNEKAKQILPTIPSAYRGPEVGAPPIKTKHGWLLIYCGASTKREWVINAVLFNLKDPKKVIGTIQRPILKPEKRYEKIGFVPNVTFPSGAVIVGKKLFVYYGAADEVCCLAIGSVNDLLQKLLEK